MLKTNVCLVIDLCLRAHAGHIPCEHKCDVEYINDMKDDIFLSICRDLKNRVASYAQKKYSEHIKSLYFGKNPNPS